jgi:hypothetical protein
MDNVKNMTISKPDFDQSAEVFLKVAGTESKNIQVLNADISKAKKYLDLGNGVDPKIIVRK